jgi:hypothetical protein
MGFQPRSIFSQKKKKKNLIKTSKMMKIIDNKNNPQSRKSRTNSVVGNRESDYHWCKLDNIFICVYLDCGHSEKSNDWKQNRRSWLWVAQDLKALIQVFSCWTTSKECKKTFWVQRRRERVCVGSEFTERVLFGWELKRNFLTAIIF